MQIQNNWIIYPTPRQRNPKMMFLKRWLLNKLQNLNTEKIPMASTASIGTIDQPGRGLRFTVYHANGGRVVETTRYDTKKDRHDYNLYIISNDADFGKEIDKICTLEYLR